MNLDYVPLLRVMRELHDIPRGQPPDFNGMRRFRQYLRTIFPHDESADQLLPLLAMNPMGKDHLTALLDEFLAVDAEDIGARVAAEASARLADVPGGSRPDSWWPTISWMVGPTATITSSRSALGPITSAPGAARRSGRVG